MVSRRLGAPPPAADATRPAQRGFSLVEALFAAALLAMGGGAFLRSVTAAGAAGHSAVGADLAARVARDRLDRLHAAPMHRTWPLPGYHPSVAPGGEVDPGGAGVPGYVAWFDEHGDETDESRARFESRWRVEEATPAGGDLAGLAFTVVVLPVGGGRAPVVRLSSFRAANGE